MLGLFKSKKQSRYSERVLPSDMGVGIQNSTFSLNSQEAIDFFSMPKAGLFNVNETTAMRVAAVYGCVEKISVIATLPKHIYERTATGSQRIDHDYWPLLNSQPNDKWTAASMWERNIHSMLLRGDGFDRLIKHSRTGKITGLVPYLRENVFVMRGYGGAISYRLTDAYTGEQYVATPDEVVHIPGFGYNGYHGMSVIQYAARSGIGVALSADESSAEFFSNGQRPDYVITAPTDLKKEQREALKQSLEDNHRGLGNQHKPLILFGGMDVKPLSLTAEDAQLIQTQQFQIMNICIAFGVPPQLVGVMESSKGWAGSSLEQLNLGFAQYTLKQHIGRMEQELNRKLFPGNQKYFIKFNLDAFLEGDSAAQAQYFNKALGGPGAQGWMSVNEARALKNLPPDPNPKYDQVIESGALTTIGTNNASQPA